MLCIIGDSFQRGEEDQPTTCLLSMILIVVSLSSCINVNTNAGDANDVIVNVISIDEVTIERLLTDSVRIDDVTNNGVTTSDIIRKDCFQVKSKFITDH
jgi:hypothetical protein